MEIKIKELLDDWLDNVDKAYEEGKINKDQSLVKMQAILSVAPMLFLFKHILESEVIFKNDSTNP